MLENYLKLQQLIYPEAFNYTIELEDSLQKQDILIPTMIIQPFVENAVIHGMEDRKGGNITIRFYSINGSVQVDIEDDGNGISYKGSDSKQQLHRSMSSGIIQERFDFLRKSTKKQVNFEVTDAIADAQHPGTKVKISLPKVQSTDFS